MKVIEANLPALGIYNIRFINEAKEIYNSLGSAEFSRLDNINHLGIASYVFTGTNHSRLEYVYLQCAIIELLPKFHKGNEALSLGGKVSIPDQRKKISSGEELLKCWALLSNAGHAQYTFGVERSLLNKANEDREFKKLLIQGVPRELRRECRRIINDYDDSSFHLIFTLFRIGLLNGPRLKARLYRIMRVLILPMEELNMPTSSERYKIFRLKKLYKRVRLLSIVALDSYYSHHPIRYDVFSALMNLDLLFSDPGVDSNFIRLLEETSAWMADELYMHPKAAAAQKYYEVISKEKLETKYRNRLKTRKEFEKFFLNFMNNGFGKPKIGNLIPIARMTFPYEKKGSWFGKSIFELNSILENKISSSEKDHVSVLLNPYSNRLHIDLLYDINKANFESVGLLYSKTVDWLLRLIEAQLKNASRSFPKSMRSTGFGEHIRKINKSKFIKAASPSIRSLFEGAIQFLLPEDESGCFSEVISSRDEGPIGYRLNLKDGSVHNTIESEIKNIFEKNQSNLDAHRLHELNAVKKIVARSRAIVVIASLEKFIIRSREGKDSDDWDGVVLEIFKEGAVLSIIEAKKTHNKASGVNESFKQLMGTVKIVKRRHKLIQYRRIRLIGYGATLRFFLKRYIKRSRLE